ncbi:MAG: helix-turn-helix transcriptional regulator [Collinsella sp.]
MAFQDDPKLATGAGAAYAAGILMKFAVNLLNCGGIVELIVLGAATIAISALSVVPQKAAESSNSAINPFIEPSHALAKQSCWSIALVMILACLFSTLDNVVTLSNAHGTIAANLAAPLFMASGLAAGLIFNLAERRYMGLVMLGIAVLSTISILAVEAGADPNLGLVVFYLSSGFFVTFFTATFTQLAPRMHAPALWAGMGRAANNVCAFTTSGLSLALVTSDNVALIMIGALVLLVAACAAFVAAGLFRLPQTEQEREREQLAKEALAAPTIEEQRQAFIADHALTPREVDVLIAVTQDERPLKQIAEELGISMRMVQRHLSSIYQKTDTQTRAGLTKAFPSA